MKKLLIISAILAVLIGSNFALALEPCPLAFDVLTSPPGQEVVIEVFYKDQAYRGKTVNGELVMDLGEYGIPNCIYQNFDLVVTDCSADPVCHKVVSFNPDGYTTIDIKDAWLGEVETTTTTIPEECDPCYCEECVCEECPEKEGLDDLLVAFFSVIAGGFAVFVYKGKVKFNKKNIDKLLEAMPKGCGIRLFKAYNGKSDIKHYHRSPNNYHTLDKNHKGKYDHEGEKNLFPDFEGD